MNNSNTGTVAASRKLLQAHLMMTKKSTTSDEEQVVKSASPLVGATALARIFRRYERRRCRETIRIWFANAILASPMKKRRADQDTNTTSWALLQVWQCATRTKLRAVRVVFEHVVFEHPHSHNLM